MLIAKIAVIMPHGTLGLNDRFYSSIAHNSHPIAHQMQHIRAHHKLLCQKSPPPNLPGVPRFFFTKRFKSTQSCTLMRSYAALTPAGGPFGPRGISCGKDPTDPAIPRLGGERYHVRKGEHNAPAWRISAAIWAY